ncbi:hypothetical protein ACLVWU_17700 [Bdellovibrio sp. HCB290]|uniref:GHMP family kinase ATP-binding protein n=1 Tax=Bdellovibrio sp. HCB290 TaxID=3394356 RepID=UPI0039B562B8
MVFKTSIPYRIGLIGGGTDLPFFTNEHGTEIINASFKAYSHCEIQKIQSPHISVETKDYKTHVQIDKLPEMALLAKDEFRISLAVLNHFAGKITDLKCGIQLKTYSDFAPQTGLGGSSAHLISVLKTCLQLLNETWDDQRILDTAHTLERNTLSIFGGFQDFYPCLLQGAHHLSKKPDSEIIHKKLDSDFLKKLDLSFYVLESKETSLGEMELPDAASLKLQKQFAQDAAQAWQQNDGAKFKKILRSSWNIKQGSDKNPPHVFALKSCGLSKRMRVLAVEKSQEKSFVESTSNGVRKVDWN